MIRQKISAEQLHGVITALVTPFDKSKVNLEKYDQLIERAIEAKIAGVLPLGTTGEAPALTDSERHAVIQRAVTTADDRILVIVGVGTNNTQKTIQNARLAAELGANAVLVVTPYYNKPGQAGLKKHFTAVANTSPIPLILYHVPGRCGVGISKEVVLDLAKHDNIIAVKEAGGDVFRSGEIAQDAPQDFVVLSGDDALTLPLMSVGAKGVISVTSNIVPELMKKLVDDCLSGNYEDALGIHRRLSPLFTTLFLETNPAPIKEALNLIKLDVGQVREPLFHVNAATKKALKTAIKEVGDLY